MSNDAEKRNNVIPLTTKVGYGCPPVHSRFKKGQSGNPSGRAKGGENLKTIFNKVLDEKISLREESEVKKVSKGEALVRGMVVGALKGDQRSLAMLFRLAEQTGQFQEAAADITEIRRVVVSWKGDEEIETEY
jgi:Family of unknown function (DUF5681)